MSDPQNSTGKRGAARLAPAAPDRTGQSGVGEERKRQDFLDLLMPHYPLALAYAQSISGSLMDGEDLVSDAVLLAFSRFDQLRDHALFKPWFFRILLNRFKNLRSRSLLRPLTLVAEPTDSRYFWEATARTSGDPAELGYQLTLVKELLGRLQPRERETLLLLGPAGFTPEEVAQVQHSSRRAVIQCAYRARHKLAQMMPEGALPIGSTPAEVKSDE